MHFFNTKNLDLLRNNMGIIMTIILDGTGLTIEKLVQVARYNEKIQLHPDAINSIKACRSMLEKKIKLMK